jgi:hypothetical protein
MTEKALKNIIKSSLSKNKLGGQMLDNCTNSVYDAVKNLTNIKTSEVATELKSFEGLTPKQQIVTQLLSGFLSNKNIVNSIVTTEFEKIADKILAIK